MSRRQTPKPSRGAAGSAGKPGAGAGRRGAIPRAAPALSLPLWASLCFFASGAAGLLYEVVWSKQLSYLLGNSLYAIATVVAAFLCGLAIGARMLGVPLARRGDGARIYALLELGVGLLGIVSLPVLRGLDPLIGQLDRTLGEGSAGFALARFAILFVLLLPPTALMGATLPVLVGHFERARVGPALAWLYALNTFGAVAGSMLGGFALMPGVGLSGTTWVAALLNVVVAIVAWRAAASRTSAGADCLPHSAPAERPVAAASTSASASPIAGPQRIVTVLLVALSGFAALAFQIAWVRLFSLVFGSSVYSFSAVLGVYLAGLALGSALVARFLRYDASFGQLARLQLALAASAALMLHTFSRLPQWQFDLAARAGARWSSLFLGEVALAASLLLVPCALLGATFPIATRLLQRQDPGHATGFAYAVNTAGTIAGSLVAGFFMVPTWGVQGTHLAALLIALAVGLTALALGRARGEAGRTDLTVASLGLVVVGGLAVLAPRWDARLMSSGGYRPAQADRLARYAQYVRGPGGVVWRASRLEKVLFYREGPSASVMVGADPEGKERWLRVDGKIDAGTGEDMVTQVLLGLLPAVSADSGSRALVIGLGSGTTAAALLAGGAGRTEIVELEPAVVEAARFFNGYRDDPLTDPRVKLTVGDARTRVLHGEGRYGIIVSEPSNPWLAGVNNLFTVDFYRRVRQRLEPDGVFCQWMQLYELSPETFRTMIASFLEVFPHGHAFSVWRAHDLLLVAMPDTRRIDFERLNRPAVRSLLAQAGIESPEQLIGYYAAPLDSLRALARGAPLNRDDRPLVEYRAPMDLIRVGRSVAADNPPVTGLVPVMHLPPAGALFSGWPRERWIEARVRSLVAQGQIASARQAADAARRAGLETLATRLTNEIAVGEIRQRSSQAIEQARLMLAGGNEDAGRRALEQAVVLDPTNAPAWFMLADRRRLDGEMDGADSAITRGRAVAADPTQQADGRMLAGMMALARDRAPLALEHFRAAQILSPTNARAYLFEAQTCQRAGDLAGARAAARRGLAAIPGEPNLTSMLATLGPGK